MLRLIGYNSIGWSRFGATSSSELGVERTSRSLRKQSATFGYAKVPNYGSVPMTQLNQHASGAKLLVLRRMLR